MYKLLIADDEEIICQTIANSIDWAALNIRICGICFDGVDAYHTILDESPDLVMTDIRMPGISGLELIERVHAAGMNTRFIILSGYGEFEYAKRAMKNGVRHYLLKPSEDRQIIECVKDVIHELQKESLEASSAPGSNQLALQTLHETLITNLIREGISLDAPSEDLYEHYEHYLNLTEEAYQLCFLYYLEEKNLSQALSLIETFAAKRMSGVRIQKIYMQNILLLFFPAHEQECQDIDRFLSAMHFPQQEVSIEYHREEFANLKALMENLLPRLKRYDTLYFLYDGRMIPSFNYRGIFHQINSFIEGLAVSDSFDLSVARTQVAEMLRTISNPDLLLQASHYLLTSMITRLNNGSMTHLGPELQELSQLTDTNELRVKTCEIANRLLESYEKHNLNGHHHYSPCVTQLRNYLNEHMEDSNLSLKWIADNVLYMNVNYVSRIFAKETGKRFSTYLTELRIERAKEILSGGQTDKILNVAELVGCGNNPYYFSKIFKKATGMSPSAYVKKFGNPI